MNNDILNIDSETEVINPPTNSIIDIMNNQNVIIAIYLLMMLLILKDISEIIMIHLIIH